MWYYICAYIAKQNQKKYDKISREKLRRLQSSVSTNKQKSIEFQRNSFAEIQSRKNQTMYELKWDRWKKLFSKKNLSSWIIWQNEMNNSYKGLKVVLENS